MERKRAMWQGGEGKRPGRVPGRVQGKGTACQLEAGISSRFHMGSHDLGIGYFCTGKGVPRHGSLCWLPEQMGFTAKIQSSSQNLRKG